MGFHLERNYAGDPLANTGVWGPQTSQANFCEEDYAVTRYVAEFVNSLTNLAYVYFALRTLPRGVSLWTSWSNLALLTVGISSLIFHMTLKQLAQLGDDLSMFWVCAAIIFQLYTTSFSLHGKLAFGTSLMTVLVTIGYLHGTRDVIWLHTFTFGVLVSAIWPRTLYLIRRRLSAAEKKVAMRKFQVGGLAFVVGFGFWVLDCGFCFKLREMREAVGWPWAAGLEFHSIWHLLTSVGAGSFVELTHWLTSPRMNAKAASGKVTNGNVTNGKIAHGKLPDARMANGKEKKRL